MINIPKIKDDTEQDITLPKLMRTKQVLEYFNIHRSTLYSWTKSKKLNPIKIQHSKFYKVNEVKSLVE
jgi:predicted site-specific integrase-resolvase